MFSTHYRRPTRARNIPMTRPSRLHVEALDNRLTPSLTWYSDYPADEFFDGHDAPLASGFCT